MLKLVDVHVHLSELSNPEEKIRDALMIGVEKFVSSVIRRENLDRELILREKFPGHIYISVGYMPGTWNANEFLEWFEKIKSSVIAIGEVGLDFGRDITRDEIEMQIADFKTILEYARDNDIPVIVHSRNAGKHAIEVVNNIKYDRVLFHAFDGSPKYAKRTHYYFSVPPSIVRSPQKQSLVESLPLEQLLLETDAPALGPSKDEENEPKNILYSLREISRIKSTTYTPAIPDQFQLNRSPHSLTCPNLDAYVSEITTKNAEYFFDF
ncbi:MAG: TatD family hydrolase [Candidatus Korarchaeota archaeon]